jgi:beta-galactosidase
VSGDALEKPIADFHGWDVEYGQFVDAAGTHRQADQSKPWWIREWGDWVDNWSDQQGSTRVARAWGEGPMLVQARSHLRSLDKIYAEKNPPGGADVWAGIDAYRGYHHQPFLGSPLDVFRLPKFDYYFFQSQRPAQAQAARLGSGPMVFIASFYTLYSPADVTVFSNCEQVRLYQTGKLVATQSPDAGYHLPHAPFTFNIVELRQERTMLFSDGVAPANTPIAELKAEGLIGGKVVATHVVRAPGVPTKLTLTLDTCGRDLVADGADWIRIYAQICDQRGTIHPFADDVVTFSVEGAATLIGDARIFANPLRAEAGIATNLVRATTTAGSIRVRASAPGLDEAMLQFDSKPHPPGVIT